MAELVDLLKCKTNPDDIKLIHATIEKILRKNTHVLTQLLDIFERRTDEYLKKFSEFATKIA
jgi:hypothetical protein